MGFKTSCWLHNSSVQQCKNAGGGYYAARLYLYINIYIYIYTYSAQLDKSAASNRNCPKLESCQSGSAPSLWPKLKWLLAQGLWASKFRHINRKLNRIVTPHDSLWCVVVPKKMAPGGARPRHFSAVGRATGSGNNRVFTSSFSQNRTEKKHHHHHHHHHHRHRHHHHRQQQQPPRPRQRHKKHDDDDRQHQQQQKQQQQ